MNVKIISKSPVIDYQLAGPVIFLEFVILSDDSGPRNFLALSKIALQDWQDNIMTNETYELKGLKECKVTCKYNLSQGCKWYVADSRNFKCTLFAFEIGSHITNSSLSLSHRNMKLSVLEMSTLNLGFYCPQSIREKAYLEQTLVDIEINIVRFSSRGWIEAKSSPNRSNNGVEAIYIHLCQAQSVEVEHLGLKPEVTVCISDVHPIYLWGKLSAFGTTVRSRLRIADRCQMGQDEPAVTAGPVKMASLSTGRKTSFHIPRHIRGNCRMHIAWLTITERVLRYALGSELAADMGSSIMYWINTVLSFPDISRPADLSTQEEFMHPAESLLYLSRGGHDSDWLSSQLVKTWFVSEICRSAGHIEEHFERNRTGFSNHSSYSTAQIDILRTFAGNGYHLSSVADNWRTCHYQEVWMQLFSSSRGCYTFADFARREVLVGIIEDIIPVAINYPSEGFGIGIKDNQGVEEYWIVLRDALGSTVLVYVRQGCLTSRTINGAVTRLRLLKHPSSTQTGTADTLNSSPILVLVNPSVLVESAGDSEARTIIIICDQHCSQAQILIPDHAASSPPESDLLLGEESVTGMESLKGIGGYIAGYKYTLSGQLSKAVVQSSSRNMMHVPMLDARRVPLKFLSIRAFLSLPVPIPGYETLSNVVGVVVHKSLSFADNYSSSSSSSSSKSAKKARLDAKCRIILRDESTCEVVTVYANRAVADYLVVGFVVVFSNVQHCVSASEKNVYLKVAVDMAPSEAVGVIRVCNSSELKTILSHQWPSLPVNSSKLIWAVHSTTLPSLPRTTVLNLHLLQLHNRCLWRLIGKVVTVRKVFVSFVCSHCLANGQMGHSSNFRARESLYCSTCQSLRSDVMKARWIADLVFDDGTGECILKVEGGLTLELLKLKTSVNYCSCCPNEVRCSKLAAAGKIDDVAENEALQFAIDQYARKNGSFKYSYSSRRKASTRGSSSGCRTTGFDISADIPLIGADDIEDIGEGKRRESYERNEELDSLQSRFESYLYSLLWSGRLEVVGRLLFRKRSHSQSGTSSSTSSFTRTLRVQLLNKTAPWSVSTAAVDTLARNYVELEVFGAKCVSPTDTIRDCWEALRMLG